MKVGWQKEKLGAVCSFLNRGISPTYLNQGGVCVLNQKCVRDHRINYDLARRHDETAKPISVERFIQVGDVLVNSTGTGTLGRVAQIRKIPPEPTTVDSHVTIVRPQPGKFYSDFFGYMMVFIEETIKEAGEGCGGQTELARSVLADKFSLGYPSSQAEQQRIVRILDEAFDGIATVKANAEKNLQNARAIFESHLQTVFTQRGEGWVEKTIGECFKVSSGDFLPAKSMIAIGEIDVYGGNGIAGKHNAKNLSGENIIIGRVGAKCGNVRHVVGDLWLTDNAFYISEYYYKFDLAFLERSITLKNLRNTANQAAQPVISYSTIKDVVLEFPVSKLIQKEIAAMLNVLESETQRLETIYKQKLVALDELKKSLLHQAFEGKL
ncbi:MAG: restriction endonuclease subunit S [Nitrospiraceae bacterium]|nr:restriction endonuclease subunit S [Nitrospiraceae bacterium]